MDAFVGITLELVDGHVVHGVLDDEGTHEEQYSVFRAWEIFASTYARKCVARASTFSLAEPPDTTYTVMYCKTGSINSLVRPAVDTLVSDAVFWHCIATGGLYTDKGRVLPPLPLRVCAVIRRLVRLARATHSVLHRRHTIDAQCKTQGWTTLVAVDPDTDALETMAARQTVRIDSDVLESGGRRAVKVGVRACAVHETVLYAKIRFNLDLINPSARRVSMMVDFLSRSKVCAARLRTRCVVARACILPTPLRAVCEQHTFAMMSKTTPMSLIGPTRDCWRFYLGFMPRGWYEHTLAPFTWQGLARCVVRDIRDNISRVFDLPQPLRYYALTEGLCMAIEEEQALANAASSAATTSVAAHLRALRDEEEALGWAVRGHEAACVGVTWTRWRHEHDIMLDEARRVLAERRDARDLYDCACRDALRAADTRRAWRIARTFLAAHQPNNINGSRRHGRYIPLTDAQQKQLIHAFQVMKYGPDLVPEHVRLASLAAMLQHFLNNGAWCHIVTAYEKTEQYIAHGDALRRKHDESDLPAHVLNRCRRAPDGTLMGRGNYGSKGVVYVPKNTKIYYPNKQHTRRIAHQADMGGRCVE